MRRNMCTFPVVKPLDGIWRGVRWGRELELVHQCLDATFVQLSPSMIREKTLPPMVHLMSKMASLCSLSSWVAKLLKALLTTKSSPSSGPLMISSKDSFKYSCFPSSSSTSISSSKEAWNSTRVTTFLLGQSEVMWPSPSQRKHLRFSLAFGAVLGAVGGGGFGF